MESRDLEVIYASQLAGRIRNDVIFISIRRIKSIFIVTFSMCGFVVATAAMQHLLLLLLVIRTSVVDSHEYSLWDYQDRGETWRSVQNWFCGGERQSPIDIITKDVVKSPELTDLKLTNFDRSFDGEWTNTGHTVKFTPSSSSSTAAAIFDNHRGSYALQQFHFHWGPLQNGSEHCLDGQSFKGELHFVTKEATRSPTDGDSFAVLGVWLVDDPDLDIDGSVWMELLSSLPKKNSETNSANGVKLSDFLPGDMSYYYYEGSLTTPPCDEVVQWFMLRNPIRVPSVFLSSLRKLVDGVNGEPLRINSRVLQPLNKRVVMTQDTTDLNLVMAIFGTTLLTMLTFVICLRAC